MFTHVNISTLSTSCIDRAFISIAPSSSTVLQFLGGSIRTPMEWHAMGLSDHAPTYWSIAQVNRDSSLPPRIPPYVCNSSFFKQSMQIFLKEVDLSVLSPIERMACTKVLIHEAAREAKDKIMSQANKSQFGILASLSSVARCMWRADLHSAELLIAKNHIAAQHMFCENGEVKLFDHKLFEEAFAEAKNKHIDKQRHTLLANSKSLFGLNSGSQRNDSTTQNRMQHSKSLRHLEKRQALFRPKAPYLAIRQISITEAEANRLGCAVGVSALSSPADIAKGIAHMWAPVFSHKDTNTSQAEKILALYTKHVKWDWSAINPPTLEHTTQYFEKAKNSAPGWDGIPNAAYKHGGLETQESVFLITQSLINGSPPPPNHNLGIWIFPRKKPSPSLDPPPMPLHLAPKETRSLTLKCTDNKANCSTTIACIAPLTKLTTHSSQNGFVPGRQLLQNPVDIDTCSRINAFLCMARRSVASLDAPLDPLLASLLAITALFDFAAAFPSIIHQWIFLVLEAIQAPSGFINLVRSMYTNVEAYGNADGNLVFLFAVHGGVLQGCPLSAALFNFAIDPLLWMFDQWLVQPLHATIKACADDIAAAMGKLASLVNMYKLFSIYRKVSGLVLQPSKCIIILDSVAATPINISIVKAWLKTNIPKWADFQITGAAKYLGVFLGPRAAQHNWKAPLAKFQAVCSHIATSGESAASNLIQYNQKAIPVMQYPAQLFQPPPTIKHIEIAALNKVLHLATNSISHGSIIALKSNGLPMRSLLVDLRASMLRAASCTVSRVEANADKLDQAAADFYPIALLYNNPSFPPGWDSPPIAHTLRDALYFQSCSSVEQLAIRKALSSPKTQPTQKIFNKCIVECATSDWELLLRRRLSVLLPDCSVNIPRACRNLVESLAHSPLSQKMMIIRTIVNSWATSCRYHEKVILDCVFGCNNDHPLLSDTVKKDELSHYLVCPRLWKIVDQAYPLQRPLPHPLHLLCLRFADSDPIPMVLAHIIYHSIRHSRGPSLAVRPSNSHYDGIIASAGRTAKAALKTIQTSG